ncbi:hypothetical protein LZ575_05650 [Antarcticibacterium sp. 1MA-6-2]|uniref:hypothetical protein n=1 Tax=Antarcticibacterium sp. 1MA-6-2 TaxID=2908210 RepID=UPI001F3B5FD1|nr:hypothetical protein [Antarcticibacterium sp. 1MA-6-2]UJH92085.1 hypothetical protein LZ575_05650 [Antarcticibacterium sp. 1MA-6-2]
MNKLWLVLFVALTINLTSQAQLKVLESNPIKIGSLKNIEVYKLNEVYTVQYRDTQYEHIDEFKNFSINEESFDQLYTLIITNWDNPPEEDITVQFNDGYLSLDYYSVMGMTSVRFIHGSNSGNVGFSKALTKKQIDKLFGKK